MPGASDVIDARLRVLVHLGGELARDAIAKALTSLPLGAFARSAIEALTTLDPGAATRIVLARASSSALLAPITRSSTSSSTVAYRATSLPHMRLREDGSVRTSWSSWSCPYAERTGGQVPVLLLESLAKRDRDAGVPGGIARGSGGIVTELVSQDHVDVAKRATRERGFLELLQIAAPAHVDPHVTGWRDTEWPEVIEAAQSSSSGVVDKKRVDECARMLRCNRAALRIR